MVGWSILVWGCLYRCAARFRERSGVLPLAAREPVRGLGPRSRLAPVPKSGLALGAIAASTSLY